MHPIIWDFGIIKISSFGTMLMIAFSLGIVLSIYRGKKVGFHPDLIMDLSVYIIISSIIGARLFFIAMNWDYYGDHLLETIQVWKGGVAVLGGVIAAVVVSYFFLKLKQISFFKIADVMIPSVALGESIGRIGCFLNGCCFGTRCNLPWAVHFPEDSFAGHVFGDAGIHPTQLYTVIYALLIFLILLLYDQRKKHTGMTFFLYFILIGIARFAIDFVRYYDDGFIVSSVGSWEITSTQITSIFLFLLGLVFFIKFSFKPKLIEK